jgi:predicted GNAT family acetyltransferase
MGDYRVVHVPEHSRFELQVDDVTAGVLDYTLRDGVAVMFHTEVFPQYGGRGGGSALVHAALETARAQGWSVVPACSFVRGYIRARPEYADLVGDSSARELRHIR